MSRETRANELLALKEIAETLNVSNDMHQMLNAVLVKLLEVTDLTTGWIFLGEEEPEYTCFVDHNLPPALTWQDKFPMCNGDCWCLQLYWEGKLKHAVNIIECKRITDAIKNHWGDTNGILHHATVPLEACGELFGILNVGTPGKEHFTDEELALLQSVAYQIGTAVKRTRLYHSQEKRARNFAKLDDVLHIGTIGELDKFPVKVVEQAGLSFDWPHISFFIQEGEFLSLRACTEHKQVMNEWRRIRLNQTGGIGAAFRENRTLMISDMKEPCSELEQIGLPRFRSAVAIPLRHQADPYGLLFVSSPKKNHFDSNDIDIIHRLADHISIVHENLRLSEQRHELARMEERNRLARDLHDSVSQKLFSLTLMAGGAESILANTSDELKQMLHEIQTLAQDTLKEMRTMIWQLRPLGLEKGLITSLKRYGEKLGLVIFEEVQGVHELPSVIEEALWRIGQEALNNVKKHAGTTQVTIKLISKKQETRFEVIDYGQGFTVGQAGSDQSMGMLTMRERAEMLGGIFSITSEPGFTRVKVTIPRK